MSRTNYKLFTFALPLVILLGLFTASYVHAQNATCNVVDVQIRNNFTITNPTGDDDADGETNWQEEFMIDSNPPFVYFDIKTTGCLDANTTYDMELSLTEHDDGAPNPLMGYIPDFTDDDVNNISELDDFNIDVPSNDFTVAYLAGEDECEGTGDPDCDYHAEIWDGDSSAEQWSALNYSCDAACDEGWVFKGFLPYGANHAVDQTGVIPPTTSPGVFSGMTTDYLAPLPGVGGTADLHGFLQSLFNVLIIIAGILAIIMIVIGAVTYVSTDSFSGTEHGREVMMNAVLGLILALGAWVILNTINPNLASNLSITIPRIAFEGDSATYGSSASSSGGGTITAFQLPGDLGLYCPGSGGATAMPQIIDSFVGKVAYRWGGKGGPLPAGASFPLSPNEQSDSPYTCKNDAGQTVPCNSFCPGGNVCLDCSGFVNHVRQCAGAPIYLTGTAGMTGSSAAEPVDMSQLSGDGTRIGAYTLVPGDLLIWDGHVVIYYGNGKIAEAAGGTLGRQTNGMAQIDGIRKYKNRITHIIKMP